jgi:hypothetical protein
MGGFSGKENNTDQPSVDGSEYHFRYLLLAAFLTLTMLQSLKRLPFSDTIIIE